MKESSTPHSDRQAIVKRLLKNLEAADEQGKRKILDDLLEHVDPLFLTALKFALDMTTDQTEQK